MLPVPASTYHSDMQSSTSHLHLPTCPVHFLCPTFYFPRPFLTLPSHFRFSLPLLSSTNLFHFSLLLLTSFFHCPLSLPLFTSTFTSISLFHMSLPHLNSTSHFHFSFPILISTSHFNFPLPFHSSSFQDNFILHHSTSTYTLCFGSALVFCRSGSRQKSQIRYGSRSRTQIQIPTYLASCAILCFSQCLVLLWFALKKALAFGFRNKLARRWIRFQKSFRDPHGSGSETLLLPQISVSFLIFTSASMFPPSPSL
jgi:hypothetical protein